MRYKLERIVINLMSLIETIAVVAFFVFVALCGGAEYQITEADFNRQFFTCGIAALACIGLVGIMEAIRYAIETRD